MIESSVNHVAELGHRLHNDAYMAWFSAESECERALHAWFAQPGPAGAPEYLAYCGALEREEAAARDLQGVCGSTARRVAAPQVDRAGAGE